jgi:predicted Zn-dependent protease
MAAQDPEIRAKAMQAAQPLSPSEEYYLGRAVAAQILSTYPLSPDPQLQLYLNLVGQTVARKSSRPNPYRGYHFGVLDSPEPNAFACPGGIILITRGLMALCADEDELAAALAHEVAHVARRDGVRAIKASRWAEVVAAVRLQKAKAKGGRAAELANLYAGSIEDVHKTILVNGYGRKSEWAADLETLRTLREAGYNPQALGSLLAKMTSQTTDAKGIYRTHPPTEMRERLAHLKAQKGGPPDEAGEKNRARRFQQQVLNK